MTNKTLIEALERIDVVVKNLMVELHHCADQASPGIWKNRNWYDKSNTGKAYREAHKLRDDLPLIRTALTPAAEPGELRDKIRNFLWIRWIKGLNSQEDVYDLADDILREVQPVGWQEKSKLPMSEAFIITCGGDGQGQSLALNRKDAAKQAISMMWCGSLESALEDEMMADIHGAIMDPSNEDWCSEQITFSFEDGWLSVLNITHSLKASGLTLELPQPPSTEGGGEDG